MNIALFGGSFDPPHIGHEKIVYEVLDNLNYIDKLIIVPTFLNPFKHSSYFSSNERLKLMQKLFDNNKKIKISDFEIKQNKPTPSIETVNYFKSIYNPTNIYLIIGADNLKSLHLWHNFDKLKKLVTFIIITRDSFEVKNDTIQYIQIKLSVNISSSILREKLDLKFIPKNITVDVKNLWNKYKKRERDD